MPIIDVCPEDFEGDDLSKSMALMRLMTVMLHPSDAAARAMLTSAVVARGSYRLAEKLGAGISFEPSAIHLARAPDPDDLVELATAPVVTGFKHERLGGPCLSAGSIAGHLLFEVFRLEDENPASATLDRARARLSSRLQKMDAKKARPKDLIAPWKAFRSVAHWWAAYLLTDDDAGSFGLIYKEPAKLRKFLMLGEAMADRGEAIKHKNAAAPVLVPEHSWRLRPEFRRAEN
jgi:hypothetical protein